MATEDSAAGWDTIIGQAAVVGRIRASLGAAARRGAAPRHLLLTGAPGLGKSTIAGVVATQVGGRLWRTSGPLLGDVGALVQMLWSVGPGDVLFLDEVHALPRAVAEVLYEALENGRLSLPAIQGSWASTVTLELPLFTLIGATTDHERLPSPLLSRFAIRADLRPYAEAELARIALQYCRRQDDGADELELSNSAALAIGRASRGTPREALRLTRTVLDYAIVAERTDPVIGPDLVLEVLREQEIRADGLDATELRILIALRRARRPLSARSLACAAGISTGALREIHEPFLMSRGLLYVTPQGRVPGKPTAQRHG